MVDAGRSGVPRGFRKTLAPQLEPRLGFSWDVTGAGDDGRCTRARACSTTRGSAAAICGNLRNPPFIHNPIYSYSTMATTASSPGVDR